MRGWTGWILGLCLLACVGCGGGKSTDELIADLKSGKGEEGTIAARSLPSSTREAAKVVPALIEALKHKGQDVRRSSALKLGEFREQAKDAIPALQKAEQEDADARVREAAGIALSRIDPEQFPYTSKFGTAEARKQAAVVAKKRAEAAAKKP